MKKFNISVPSQGQTQVPVLQAAPAEPPPMPAHIGQPIPPATPELPLPSTFEGFVDLAKLAGGRAAEAVPLAKAAIWASLAQAHATKQVADRLDELLTFLGARDKEPAEGEEPEEVGPRLSDAITDGLVNLAMVANDELLPEGAIQLMKLQLAAKLAEELK